MQKTKQNKPWENHNKLHEGSLLSGDGLSLGCTAAASWQVACVQGLAQTMENP